jgi:hypothetical protein
LLEGESEFGVLVEELDDLLLHRGLFLAVGAVELLDDPGDLFLLDLLLVLFKLPHGLFYILLLVGVSVEDVVVLLLEHFELVLQLLDVPGVLLLLFGEELVLVEVGLELAQLDLEAFYLVEVFLVELLVGCQLVGLLLADSPLAVQLLAQIAYSDSAGLSL